MRIEIKPSKFFFSFIFKIKSTTTKFVKLTETGNLKYLSIGGYKADWLLATLR